VSRARADRDRWTIAVAAYPPGWLGSWEEYERKLGTWVAEAAEQAELLVFPEYAAMELASLAGADACRDLQRSLAAVGGQIAAVDALHASLASAFGVHICAASQPVAVAGRWVNRARLFGPNGLIGVQDKRVMTRFEREHWSVSGGGPLRLFDLELGRVGILICYDIEFPLLARALVEQGVEVLLVPSCTDTLAGHWRVRVGAMARALEGQCLVAQAVTVGALPWLAAIDSNVGAAAVYAPPDCGFPSHGVLARGVMNQPGWVYAEVDRAAIRRVRAEGDVLNCRHWVEQEGCAVESADTEVVSAAAALAPALEGALG